MITQRDYHHKKEEVTWENPKTSVYIHVDGNIGIQGNSILKTTFNTVHPETQSNQGGIRPAMWIAFK